MLNQLFILHRLNSVFLPCILFGVPITGTLYHWLPVVHREQTKTQRRKMRSRRPKQKVSQLIFQRSICPSGNTTQMIMSIIRSEYLTAKLLLIRLMKHLLFLFREIISLEARTGMEHTLAKSILTLRSTVIRLKQHPL